jgi:hypothetical protein
MEYVHTCGRVGSITVFSVPNGALRGSPDTIENIVTSTCCIDQVPGFVTSHEITRVYAYLFDGHVETRPWFWHRLGYFKS